MSTPVDFTAASTTLARTLRELESQELAVEAKTPRMKAFEMSMSGTYRKDPEAPMRTLSDGQKLGWYRTTQGASDPAETPAKAAKRLIKSAEATIAMWDAGLDKGWKGAFTFGDSSTFSRERYNGLDRAISIDPNEYETAQIELSQVNANGDRKILGMYKWDRTSRKWKKFQWDSASLSHKEVPL